MQSEHVIVDPYLQEELRQGEQLLWWGRPDPKRLVKGKNTNSNYVIYGFTSVFWVLLIFYNWYQVTHDPFGTNSISVILLIAAVLLLGVNLYRIYLIYTQSQKVKTSLSNTLYGITNQRIIIITKTNQGFAVKSQSQNDIGQIVRTETGEGWGDVSYGNPRSVQIGARTTTIVDKLAAIPDARTVENILLRTFKQPGPPLQQGWNGQPPVMPYQPYPSMPQQNMQPPQ